VRRLGAALVVNLVEKGLPQRCEQWDDLPQTLSFRLPRASEVTDFWSGEALGRHEGVFAVKDLPPRSGKLLVCG
jgi:hypothetical protein